MLCSHPYLLGGRPAKALICTSRRDIRPEAIRLLLVGRETNKGANLYLS